MPLKADYDNSTNGDLLQKIEMALVATAIQIQAEATSTANHAARSAKALLVIANPVGYAQQMAPLFTANKDNDATAVDTSSTDAAILTRASSIWNASCVQS